MLKRFTTLALALSLLAGAFVPSVRANDEGEDSEAREVKVVDIACMKTAVEPRETAILAAFNKFSTAGVAALTERKTDLVAAWGISDREDRKEAIKMAWSDFKESAKTAKRTLKKERKEAWKTFKEAAKLCGGGKEEESGERGDNQL